MLTCTCSMIRITNDSGELVNHMCFAFVLWAFLCKKPTMFCKVVLWHIITTENLIILMLIGHYVHVLNSAVWLTKMEVSTSAGPCPNHAFPSQNQNSPRLANLQMYSNLHSYAKSSSNEAKSWHVIRATWNANHDHSWQHLTTFKAWRGAFDHFSCCYLAEKYCAKPRIEIHKSTNTLGLKRNLLLLYKLFV